MRRYDQVLVIIPDKYDSAIAIPANDNTLALVADLINLVHRGYGDDRKFYIQDKPFQVSLMDTSDFLKDPKSVEQLKQDRIRKLKQEIEEIEAELDNKI